MELDPHQLIEGTLIACYAIGAAQAFLYVRGEMALAQERIAQALNDAYANSLVGTNILGTDFSVDITLTWGAGAYIVGEETALIESLEGERGMPASSRRSSPPPRACTCSRRSSTTSRRSPTCRGSSTSRASRSTTSARRRRPACGCSPCRGHVKRPGVFEVPNGVTTFRDADRGAGVLRWHPRRGPREGVHPRRRQRHLVLRRAPRPAARQADGRQGRLDARLGRDRRHGRHHRHGRRLLAHRALLRPRESAASARRAGRARPGWSGSSTGSSKVTDGPTTSTRCWRSASRSARASRGRRARPRSARSARRR